MNSKKENCVQKKDFLNLFYEGGCAGGPRSSLKNKSRIQGKALKKVYRVNMLFLVTIMLSSNSSLASDLIGGGGAENLFSQKSGESGGGGGPESFKNSEGGMIGGGHISLYREGSSVGGGNHRFEHGGFGPTNKLYFETGGSMGGGPRK